MDQRAKYKRKTIKLSKEKWKWSCSVMSDSLLCDPVDYSPPGSSIHGILQTRILEWVAISFSRGSSRPRDRTQVSRIAGRRFNLWATREAPKLIWARCISWEMNPGLPCGRWEFYHWTTSAPLLKTKHRGKSSWPQGLQRILDTH